METREDLLSKLKPMELPPLPENPLISVLIANYNYGQYIGEAIESVLTQTYQNFEIVICDDGSTDNSLEVIRHYRERDSRVRCIAKVNAGHASAVNDAFEKSNGSVIAILDADDVWLPEKIERVIELFRRKPLVGLVCHPMKVVTWRGKVLKDSHGRNLTRGWAAPELIAGNGVVLAPASGLTLRREVANACFPLPNVFRTWADRCLYERAALVTEVDAIGEILALYRQHGTNVTGASGVTTFEKIDKAIHQLRLILEDRARFLRAVHGIEIDPMCGKKERPLC